MSIVLQLANPPVNLAGTNLRTELGTDMTAIQTEVNNLDVVTAGLAGNVTTAWVSGTVYAIGDFRRSPINFQTYRRLTVGAGITDPSADPANWIATAAGNASQVFSAAPAVNPEHVPRADQIQAQSLTAFTTGGTATAFTLTPIPALIALAANQRFRVKFNVTAGVAPTLAVSGLAPNALKFYNNAGAKVAVSPAQVVVGMLADVEFDGVDYVVMDPCGLDAATAISAGTAGNLTGAPTFFAPITASLGADVTLSVASTFFDGPSVAQGTVGKWFVSGTICLADPTTVNPVFDVKLWDGATVIASAHFFAAAASTAMNYPVSLSGFISAPVGNLRISVMNSASATAKIRANLSGLGKDSTITATRIG